MRFNFSQKYWICGVVLCCVASRMCAASPTSVSRSESSGSRGVSSQKFVADEVQEDYDQNKSMKQENVLKIATLEDEKEAVEKECGVDVQDYVDNKEISDELRGFCVKNVKRGVEESSGTDKRFEEDLKKCNNIICSWYNENCEKIMKKEHKFDMTDLKHKSEDPNLKKCRCVLKFWNKDGCEYISKENDEDGGKISTKKHDLAIEDGFQSDQAPMEKRSNDDNYDPDAVVFGEDESEDDKPKWQNPHAVKQNTFDRQSYSEKERDCFAIRAVWYEGKCHELNSVSACPADGPQQWLVLERPKEDESELLKPVCKPKPCSKANEIYWPSSKSCIKKSDALKSCLGKGQLVKSDAFGDGFCTCDDEAGAMEKSEDCHKFYQQGPCKEDEIVTYDTATGFALCSSDKCFNQNNPSRFERSSEYGTHHITKYGDTSQDKPSRKQRDVASFNRHSKDDEDLQLKNNAYRFEYVEDSSVRIKRQTNKRRPAKTTVKPVTSKKTFAPMNSTGDCFKLGSSEPCSHLGGDVFFKIDPFLHFPRCVQGSLELYLIDGKPGCKVDEQNNCREEVKLAQTNQRDFLNSLMVQARRKRNAKT